MFIVCLCLLSAALTKHMVTRRCGLTYRLACMLPLIALDVTLPAVLFDPATSLLPTAIASALLSFWKTLKLIGEFFGGNLYNVCHLKPQY